MNDTVVFTVQLVKLLVFEYGKTEKEAEELVAKHDEIVLQGIMNGLTFSSLRVTAMAIDMAESGQL